MESTWNGFKREDFLFNGFKCILVSPEHPLPGNPFVWRAEFFDAFAQCDLEMVRRGYYLTYINLSDKYGCPWAIERMKEYYDYLTGERGLGLTPLIFGFSRGGLYTTNFALTYPDCVGKIYLDAPVLSVLSWPGGKGSGIGAPREWQECLECFGRTEQDISDCKEAFPVRRGAELARLDVPVALVAGGADDVVPYNENGFIFADAFTRAGGRIFIRIKPTCGHHPHSLEDVTELCDFLCR